MPRSRSEYALLRCAIAAPLLTSALLASPTPLAKEGAPAACDKPLMSAVVIDDLSGAPAWMADQTRRFRLPTPAQALRKSIDLDACLAVLEADPIFSSVPGTAQPDLILRARIVELRASERSLGEKASTAIERYLGSYLGSSDAEIPVLSSAAVSVDVLCPKTRRIAAEVGAQTSGTGAERAEQNADVLRQAFGDAARDLAAILKKTPPPCQAAP